MLSYKKSSSRRLKKQKSRSSRNMKGGYKSKSKRSKSKRSLKSKSSKRKSSKRKYKGGGCCGTAKGNGPIYGSGVYWPNSLPRPF